MYYTLPYQSLRSKNIHFIISLWYQFIILLQLYLDAVFVPASFSQIELFAITNTYLIISLMTKLVNNRSFTNIVRHDHWIYRPCLHISCDFLEENPIHIMSALVTVRNLGLTMWLTSHHVSESVRTQVSCLRMKMISLRYVLNCTLGLVHWLCPDSESESRSWFRETAENLMRIKIVIQSMFKK